MIASGIRRTAAEANPRQFADRLTDALAAAVASEAGPLSPETRWPVASVVCLALAPRQVWRIGDCHILIDETAHPATKRVDDASYGFRAVINSALLAKGLPLDRVLAEDPGAEASRPLYDLQQHLANTLGPWGYGCINGSRIQDQHIEVFNVPEGRHQVVLATDGYPDVQPTLAASEQRLAELMQTDPAAVGPLWRMGKPLRPGYGAMDDRALRPGHGRMTGEPTARRIRLAVGATYRRLEHRRSLCALDLYVDGPVLGATRGSSVRLYVAAAILPDRSSCHAL